MPPRLQSLLRRQLHCCHPSSTSKDPRYYYYFYLFIPLFARGSCRQLTQQKISGAGRRPRCPRQHPARFYFLSVVSNSCGHGSFSENARPPRRFSIVKTRSVRLLRPLSHFFFYTLGQISHTWMWFSLFVQPTLCFTLLRLVYSGGSCSAVVAQS